MVSVYVFSQGRQQLYLHTTTGAGWFFKIRNSKIQGFPMKLRERDHAHGLLQSQQWLFALMLSSLLDG